jgi:hypothetical protein
MNRSVDHQHMHEVHECSVLAHDDILIHCTLMTNDQPALYINLCSQFIVII